MSFSQMMLSGRPVINRSIIISSDQVSWNLITDGFAGITPTTRTSVTITVNSGINVTSMDLTGLPAGSTIRLVNLGNIYGVGGSGGTGRSVFAEDGS